MGVYVPDSVINSELQETVSRESIRRMVQGQTCVATSETQAQILLNNAAAAGVDTVGFSIIRTDLGMKMFWDGNRWVRTGGGILSYSDPSYPGEYSSAPGDTASRPFASTDFILPAQSAVTVFFRLRVNPSGNAAGSITITVDGEQIRSMGYHSSNSQNHQFPLAIATKVLQPGNHQAVGRFAPSGGSVAAKFSYQNIHVMYS